MSVLIKGLMMPVNCQTCPFVQNEYPIGGEALVYRCRCPFTQVLADKPAFERNKDCPLVDIKSPFDYQRYVDSVIQGIIGEEVKE